MENTPKEEVRTLENMTATNTKSINVRRFALTVFFLVLTYELVYNLMIFLSYGNGLNISRVPILNIALDSGCLFVSIIIINKFFPLRSFLIEKDEINNFPKLGSFIDLIREEASHDEKTHRLSDRIFTIDRINERIIRLQRQSTVVLLSIGLLLVGAAFAIVFAGALTNIDANGGSAVDKLSSAVTAAENRVILITRSAANGNPSDIPLASDSSGYYPPTRSDQSRPSSTPLTETANTLLKDYTEIQYKKLQTLNELLVSSWKADIENGKATSDTKYIIASAVTRIAVVFVIIFLVQILLGLFR